MLQCHYMAIKSDTLTLPEIEKRIGISNRRLRRIVDQKLIPVKVERSGRGAPRQFDLATAQKIALAGVLLDLGLGKDQLRDLFKSTLFLCRVHKEWSASHAIHGAIWFVEFNNDRIRWAESADAILKALWSTFDGKPAKQDPPVASIFIDFKLLTQRLAEPV